MIIRILYFVLAASASAMVFAECVDRDPPSVVIASPANGSTVSGTVNVSANATDNVGVIGVQFKRDSANLGAEDTVSPYSTAWNTTTTSNGSHSLAAQARDAAGNVGTSSMVTVIVNNPGSGQFPYTGVPFPIPGTIQAEDYDNGGEGIAYHDTDTVNNGGMYRTDGVDIKNSSDLPTSPAIGWVKAGEWWEYTVNIATTGNYKLQARVATPYSGKSFHVQINGVNKTGTMTVPVTGAWGTAWATISKNGINLTAGQRVMRVFANTDLFDINFVKFIKQ